MRVAAVDMAKDAVRKFFERLLHKMVVPESKHICPR
jgi:hypothetical protein